MIEFLIDYFRITVHIKTIYCIGFYNEYFKNYLGLLSPLAHGAKGYKGVMCSGPKKLERKSLIVREMH